MDLIFVELKEDISLELTIEKERRSILIASKYDTFLVSNKATEILVKIRKNRINKGKVILYRKPLATTEGSLKKNDSSSQEGESLNDFKSGDFADCNYCAWGNNPNENISPRDHSYLNSCNSHQISASGNLLDEFSLQKSTNLKENLNTTIDDHKNNDQKDILVTTSGKVLVPEHSLEAETINFRIFQNRADKKESIILETVTRETDTEDHEIGTMGITENKIVVNIDHGKQLGNNLGSLLLESKSDIPNILEGENILFENNLFVFRKVSEWPDCSKSLIKPKEYIKYAIKKSFIDRVKAYLSLYNTAVYIKELKTQRIQIEPIHPALSVFLPLIYKTGAYKMKFIKGILHYLTKKAGIRFDNPVSKKNIQRFIRSYNIDMTEFETTEYNSFNEFFYRKLKKGARSVEKQDIISSPADCRILCYDGHLIKTKGSILTVEEILGKKASHKNIVVCRLAPQDYHRFHAPLDSTVKSIKYIYGDYYSVHPVTPRDNILKSNMRCIIELDTARGIVYYVAIGATLVGSIVITVKEEDRLKQLQEIGYFAFGGSCIVMIFTEEFKVVDEIKGNTMAQIETLVKVGNSIESCLD